MSDVLNRRYEAARPHEYGPDAVDAADAAVDYEAARAVYRWNAGHGNPTMPFEYDDDDLAELDRQSDEIVNLALGRGDD